MIYTTNELYNELRKIIQNIPDRCQEIVISLKAGEFSPVVSATVLAERGTAMSAPTTAPTIAKFERFYLVREKDWERIKDKIDEVRS